MSGAPVFHCQTGRLVGVLIRIPNEYIAEEATDDQEVEKRATFKERLVMVSLPYLLASRKCDAFRQLVVPNRPRSNLLPTAKKGNKFKGLLSKKIAKELSRPDEATQRLRGQLAYELDLDESATITAQQIATELVDKDPVEAIDSLSEAAEACATTHGVNFVGADAALAVKETAQQVLGWLLIASFDEEQLDKVMPHCPTHEEAEVPNTLFFTLAVTSLTGVEVVMARLFERPSVLENASMIAEHQSRYVIGLPKEGLAWDEKESARRMFIEIWNQLFRRAQKRSNEQPKPEDWKRLNAELAKRRKSKSRPEHYYIPFTAADYPHGELSDYVSQVYRHFLSQLNQMTVIQYGDSQQGCDFFVVPEDELQSTISEFYRLISEKDEREATA